MRRRGIESGDEGLSTANTESWWLRETVAPREIRLSFAAPGETYRILLVVVAVLEGEIPGRMCLVRSMWKPQSGLRKRSMFLLPPACRMPA